ncbi:MAG TPA: zinc ribbon domain-containing protein [Tepidisphaeraceae bacterium]|nr:zinc ribbon domain-containing protein [Tepidisphaeraceae bacterium]
MPIYEFECKVCGKRFDKLVKMSSSDESPKVKCPSCESPKTIRAMSVFAVNGASDSKSSAPSMGGGCACGRRAGGCGH